MSLLFSILLPTYKRRYLKECIDSVLAQTHANWELIIVNDASPEDIDSIVEAYTDSRIRYYKNKQNFGAKRLVEQWNYCLSLAKGAYVICIGDDDRLKPDCLETYAQLIARYPDVAVLHGQTDIIDENGHLLRHTPPRPETESAMRLLYHRMVERMPQFIGDFCYRTADLRAKGGYYYLPYAWGSDDISAIQAADTHGIANTQEVVFEYRDNKASITRHPHVAGKLCAVIRENLWLRKYLRKPVDNEQDQPYRNQLRQQLFKHTARKCYYILRNA